MTYCRQQDYYKIMDNTLLSNSTDTEQCNIITVIIVRLVECVLFLSGVVLRYTECGSIESFIVTSSSIGVEVCLRRVGDGVVIAESLREKEGERGRGRVIG